MPLGDVLIDQTSEFLDAVLLERHPDLEGAKAATRLQAIFMEPVSRGEPARGLSQIFLFHREARPMRSGVADQDASDFERRMQPFVRIERDRIGAGQAANPVAVRGCDGDQRTYASIH